MRAQHLAKELFPVAERVIDWGAFWPVVDELDHEQQSFVMHALYLHDGERSQLTFREVGEQLGVGVNRISQIRRSAIRRLLHPARIRRYAEEGA